MMTENQVYTLKEEARTSVWAVISLISGIANFLVLPFFGAIAALISGYIAKDEIKKGNCSVDGDSLAKAGIIMGWLGVAFSVLTFCLTVLMFAGLIGGSILLTGPLAKWLQQIPSY
jgi:hypothetical protein